MPGTLTFATSRPVPGVSPGSGASAAPGSARRAGFSAVRSDARGVGSRSGVRFGGTGAVFAGVFAGAVLTAGAAFLGATVGLQTFARSIGLAAELERSLNVFQVTAGATADQMERVSETARALGRDITLPGVAAQDAAATMTELAKAGLRRMFLHARRLEFRHPVSRETIAFTAELDEPLADCLSRMGRIREPLRVRPSAKRRR